MRAVRGDVRIVRAPAGRTSYIVLRQVNDCQCERARARVFVFVCAIITTIIIFYIIKLCRSADGHVVMSALAKLPQVDARARAC